ncbi:MAG: ATP-dependent RNA helicase HrpA [Planctomycetales bacterium]|nr:ATP-dependent RNA helicase HrpA [Planctomycetales bacterium]
MRIEQSLSPDRARLRNMLRAVRQAEEAGKPFDKNLAKLHEVLEASLARREAREKTVPKIVYDESLPVVGKREDIAAAIRDHQVVVICGETGSGKSTQIPKICLELGRGISGLIGHTQPRRIAARSIAARLAEELGPTGNKLVGYKIRFADQTSEQTLIKVMTDGVLLAESQTDRTFDQYDTIIIDEAHERSLNIDFLLGCLHRILPQRPDLRLIITSATIDAARFAEHFKSDLGAAPIIEVSGRTYPVEVRYQPLVDDEGNGDEEGDPIRGVADAIEDLCRLGNGDVLVFLPTERDIREAHQKLRGRNFAGGNPEILPLYARLSTAEQNRVFQKHGGRRIVLATNVAESSLTVPGIHFVVDTGTARISRYSPRSKVQRLPIEAVSQASADQRKGRCGRLGPGVCIRLFSEEDYLARERFTSPEIQRTNLAAVILQTLALDLGPIDEFPFLDPPRPESIRDGYKTLFELGAIDDKRDLTPLGRQLAKLPVDPRIGRIILAADKEACLADILIIAAALEVQDPRERPQDKQQAADEAQAKFVDADSDFLSYLKLWDFIHRLKSDLTRGQLRKACRQNFLSETRIREWQDVHRQLLEMVTQFGLRAGKRKFDGTVVTKAIVPLPTSSAAPKQSMGFADIQRRKDQRAKSGSSSDGTATLSDSPGSFSTDGIYASIHRSLLAGLLASIATKTDTSEYLAAGGNKFFLWPGSGTFGSRPKWIVAAELVETTKRYARTVAKIDEEWIEPLALHLVSRSHSEPVWDRRSSTVVASEKVTLFGLTIIPRRRVRYAHIDPSGARKLFLQHALVEGDYDTKAPFFAHNGRVREEAAKLAAKTRRRDMIVEDDAIYSFYQSRLPAEVVDGHSLDRWRKDAEQKNPHILKMNAEDILPAEAEVEPTDYPDKLEIDRLKLPLEYHFEPGTERDGITVTVPREALPQLTTERTDWLVPGLMEEKVEALIRSLPKQVRRELGPAPQVAEKVAGELRFGQRPLLVSVADLLTKAAGVRITPDMFAADKLPPHLLLNVRVVDEKGKKLSEGRDVAMLREQVGVKPEDAKPQAEEVAWHRDGLKSWDFDKLPPRLDVKRAGVMLTKYPALLDQGESVSLRLLDSAAEAERQTRGGVRRLFAIAENRELKAQVQWLPGIDKLKLWGAPLAKERPLMEQLMDLLADRVLFGDGLFAGLPRSRTDFEELVRARRKHIVPAVQEVTKLVLPLFEAYHEVRLALETPRPAAWKFALDDIRDQLSLLLPANFLTTQPWEWLQHFPRYLKAISLRLKKLSTALARDKTNYDLVAPRIKAWKDRVARPFTSDAEQEQLSVYRWMLEELRVSLFAQELGTSNPVSPQKLDKQWAKVGT